MNPPDRTPSGPARSLSGAPGDTAAATDARAREIAAGLYPHQVEGVAFLLGRRRAILADDMGLGKTRQSVIALTVAEPEGPYLVVCPASVKHNWAREIALALGESHQPGSARGHPSEEKSSARGHPSQEGSPQPGSARGHPSQEESPQPRSARGHPSQEKSSARGHSSHKGADVHVVGPGPLPQLGFSGWTIINYDLLKKHVEGLLAHSFKGLVFDEGHYIKNHRSQRSRLARRLATEGAAHAGGGKPAVHVLTGTPLTNRPRDLFPLLQLIGHALGQSFLAFAKRYCDGHKNDYGYWVTNGVSNAAELSVQLQGTMLRRSKDSTLDLPPKQRTWIDVDVDEAVKVAKFLILVFKRALENHVS